jgi:hypothetical protein
MIRMNLILGFLTYPRDNSNITYQLLEQTFNSLIKGQNLTNINIKIIVVGDDYPNIDELKPIFNGFDVSFYNINCNDALRNTDLHREFIWCYAPLRSIIFLHRKAMELSGSFDYLLLSADDEHYLDGKLATSLLYINHYNKPDLIYTLGKYGNDLILPRSFEDYSITIYPHYPVPENVVASGILYNLKNGTFMNDVLQFRNRQLDFLQSCMRNNTAIYPDMYSMNTLYPEDAQLWNYLQDKFIHNEYRSILIPMVFIHHYSERTVFNFIKNKHLYIEE